jgi:hypothetical protein
MGDLDHGHEAAKDPGVPNASTLLATELATLASETRRCGQEWIFSPSMSHQFTSNVSVASSCSHSY